MYPENKLEKLQLEFISYIQRILTEGDFSATYKYALLHAIADICIEQPQFNENGQFKIELSLLAEKLIYLYWNHAVPFTSGVTDEGSVLKQNTGKQSKVIQILYDCRTHGVSNLKHLKNTDFWNTSYRAALKTLKDGPLWRLQILSKQEECFLYPHDKRCDFITLNPGISSCFRRFYDLVINLSKNAWLLKVQSIKHNKVLLGGQSQLSDFLFGTDRASLLKLKPFLVELQQNLCFYCNKPLDSNTEIDHFIPYAKYSHDLAHNFVAAHRKCNNNKRDHLASLKHRDRWIEQNLIRHGANITHEFDNLFMCDEDKSLAVSNWAYLAARRSNARLWNSINEFVDYDAYLSKYSYGEINQSVIEKNALIEIQKVVPQEEKPSKNELLYFPNLRIACGHFKNGDSEIVESMKVPNGFGRLDPQKHFLARSCGNSMNGGKTPIFDGQLLLLELITPTNAGSLQNQTIVIERQDESGDDQYLLRDIKKQVNEHGEVQYQLIAKNPDYEVIIAKEEMISFARLKAVIPE